jgi:exopolysaccharide biosynthesis polyprenyl glycosylphosphotransferase
MATTLALLEAMAVFAAAWATIAVWTRPLLAGSPDMMGLLAPAIAFSLCYVVAAYYSDLYDLRSVRRFSDCLARLLKCIGIVVILMVPVFSVIPRARTGVAPLAVSLLSIIGLLLVLRAAAYRVLWSRAFIERVVLFGAGPLADQLLRELRTLPNCIVVGVVDDAEQFGKMVDTAYPDRIIIALPDRRGRFPAYQLLESRMRGTIVEDGVVAYERLTGKLAIESLTPSNLIFLKDFQKSRLAHAAGRGFSLLLSGVGLICFAPVFALLALAIKLDSPGPVFFVQERVGMGWRRFKLIKFRTMQPVQRPTSEWEKDNGDRITRAGKWLRKFRLDELPQFVNVLRGDMNLVGPRPHPASNFELLVLVSRNAPECGVPIPYYFLRSSVRPGITGWAQVRYHYANDLEEEIEKLRYDLYYIKHWSLWLDLRILFDTVKIVLTGSRSGTDATDHATATSKGESPIPGLALPGPRWTYRARRAPLAARHDREHQRAG